MFNLMKKRYLGSLLALAMVVACAGPDESAQTAAVADALDGEATFAGPTLSEDVLRDLLQSIPSPLEISLLIKETGAGYDKAYLNPPQNRKQYNTNYQRALNLGIYGADLGYTNIYNESQEGLYYLEAVRDMAEGLQIGQFFDFATLKQLALNANNLDSLLLVTTKNFNKINGYLQERDRTKYSVLIITGGWLEALHLTNRVAERRITPELKEKIGEQKIILDQLMVLLDAYQQDPDMKRIYADMQALHQLFKEVQITYTYEESKLQEVDGIMMMVDNSTSTVYITDDQMQQIARVTGEIRNKIINS